MTVPSAFDARAVAEAVTAAYGARVSPVLVSHERSPGLRRGPQRPGPLAARYEIGDGDARAILIRPDMYVGAHCRLEDAAALVDYIEQWLTPGARSRVGSR